MNSLTMCLFYNSMCRTLVRPLCSLLVRKKIAVKCWVLCIFGIPIISNWFAAHLDLETM